MSAAPSRAGRARSTARGLVVLLVAVLAAGCGGCAGATPAVLTGDVFVAAPWASGERLEYRLRNAAGDELGRGILTTTQQGDRTVLEQRYEAALPADGIKPMADVIALTVDSTTLRPIEGSRLTAGRDGSGAPQPVRTTWRYDVDGVQQDRLRLVTRSERGGDDARERELAILDHAYDNESALWLWRGLPFAEEYRAGYVSVNPSDGTQQTVAVHLPQQQEIEVPAGTFRTWRLLLRSGRAVRTAWISIDPPYEIVRWDNSEVIFELVSAER